MNIVNYCLHLCAMQLGSSYLWWYRVLPLIHPPQPPFDLWPSTLFHTVTEMYTEHRLKLNIADMLWKQFFFFSATEMFCCIGLLSNACFVWYNMFERRDKRLCLWPQRSLNYILLRLYLQFQLLNLHWIERLSFRVFCAST